LFIDRVQNRADIHWVDPDEDDDDEPGGTRRRRVRRRIRSSAAVSQAVQSET
jgi:hypothetical protein